MAAELSEHLGYEHGQAPPGGTGNARNGTTAKTIHTGHGSVRIEQPRDPQRLVRAADRPEAPAALRGFDDKIIAMYGRGMSGRLAELLKPHANRRTGSADRRATTR